jgi:hypothetical protein
MKRLDPFAGPQAKLDRSDELLKELVDEVSSFLEAEPYAVTWEVLKCAGEPVQRVARLVERVGPPLRLSVIIGDVLHNLRSALDQMTWDLAKTHSGTPPGGTEFPVFWDEARFRARNSLGNPVRGSGIFKIRGIALPAQRIIEKLQPYHREEPLSHPLYVLHQLNVIDKHRAINLAAALVAGVRQPARGDQRIQLFFSGPLAGGEEILREPAVEAFSDWDFGFNVGLRETGATGWPISDVLTRLLRYVRTDVLPPLQAFTA